MISVDPRIATGRLTIDLDALVANWRFMAEKSGKARTAAVVKADAYGTGLETSATALAGAGCGTFFVAVPDEAIRLKAALPGVTVYVLSGVFNSDSAAAVAQCGARPVLNSLAQIEIWGRHCRAVLKNLPCAIHADTGMNRLGLTAQEALVFGRVNGRAAIVSPDLLMSHLACADDPAHPMSGQQLESFQQVRAVFPGVDSSLANSAGVFLGPDFHFDLTRPGIALYGGAAVNGVPNPMRPVVTAEARILQVRHARAGEAVSYGATQVLARDSRIAIAGTGYADGFHRASSGAGAPLRDAVAKGGLGWLAGHRVPILGRVTMDLTLFDVTDVPEQALEGADWIELFGPNIALDEAAQAAGTIGYELLTSLGARYERHILQG